MCYWIPKNSINWSSYPWQPFCVYVPHTFPCIKSSTQRPALCAAWLTSSLYLSDYVKQQLLWSNKTKQFLKTSDYVASVQSHLSTTVIKFYTWNHLSTTSTRADPLFLCRWQRDFSTFVFIIHVTYGIRTFLFVRIFVVIRVVYKAGQQLQ